MCGLWASIGIDVDRRVLDAVKARGPDGEGFSTAPSPCGPVALGHRRLSIYDLSAASAQPFASADGAVRMVWNGAIYNYKDVRETLARGGVVFHTEGDTEVLMAAFLTWGVAAFQRLDGMFAGAIHDTRSQAIWLFRDRFGEKPLLYSLPAGQGQTIAVGSDLKQFRDLPGVDWRINREVAANFLNFGHVDETDETFVAGVRRLPAGCFWKLDLHSADHLRDSLEGGPRPWPGRALGLGEQTDPTLDAGELAVELRRRLERAVDVRLVADVPVGSCLSGGLDSTAVVRLARASQRASQRAGRDGRFICVSAVFEGRGPAGEDLSEKVYVDAALEGQGIDLHTVQPSDRDVADAFDAVILAQGEPFAHSSICAQWFVFKGAREAGLKVMLDGQGADELFGGYTNMLGTWLAGRLLRRGPGDWMRATRALMADDAGLARGDLARATWRGLVPDSTRRRLAAVRGTFPPKGGLISGHAPPPIEGDGWGRFDALTRRMAFHTSLPALLRYEDRNAMAHAVETRLPFLAPDVADVAFTASPDVKIDDGWRKQIIRRAVADVTPQLILDRRRKLGFATPQEAWISGALGPVLREALADRRLTPWIDAKRLDALAAGTGDAAHMAEAFRAAVLIRWAALLGLGL